MAPVQPAPGLAPGGRPASPGHGMFTLRETKPRLNVEARLGTDNIIIAMRHGGALHGSGWYSRHRNIEHLCFEMSARLTSLHL